MADDTSSQTTTSTDALTAAQNALNKSIQNNVNMAEQFYNASRKANGEQRTALEGVAALYDAIAKKEGELLEVNKDMIDLDKQHFKLIQEQQKLQDQMMKASEKEKKDLIEKLDLNKKELAAHREISNEKSKTLRKVGEDLDATRKQIAEMSKAKGFIGEIFSSARAGALAAITSAVALKKAFDNFLQVGRDAQDIQILSGKYNGMDGKGSLWNPATYAEASMGLVKYSIDMSKSQIALQGLGFSAEEAKASFKTFAQLSGDTSSMDAMTQAAGGLSKMLGVDLSETTDFMVEQNLKFNKTATQSAETLLHVQQTVEHLNVGFDKTIIRGRDITKVLFDISRESKVLAQDQDEIAKILESNIVKLQKGGANYREAFDAAKTFTNVLTKDAPEFMKILSGREVYSMLKKNSTEVIAELAKTSPEIAKRVKDVYNSKDLNQYEKERIINEMTGQTKVGMEASMKVFSRTMGVFQDGAVSRISATFGVGYTQAKQIVQQAKSELGIEGINDMLKKGLSNEDMTKEIKTKFDLDINDSQLEEIKSADADHRQSVMRSIIMQNDADAIKAKADSDEVARVQKIADLKKEKDFAEKQYAIYHRDSYKQMADDAQRGIDAAEAEGKNKGSGEKTALQGIAGQEEDKNQQGNPIGKFWGNLKGILSSPVGQLGVGVAGAGVAVGQAFLQVKANSYLAQIAENTGGEGPGNKATGMLGNMLKKVISPQGAAVAGGLAAVGITGYAGYEAYQAYKDKNADAKTKGKAYGGAAGALGGAVGGAYLGAAIGSIVPGLGTIVGGGIGAGIGALGGYFGGKGVGYGAGYAVDRYNQTDDRPSPVDTSNMQGNPNQPNQSQFPGISSVGSQVTQSANLIPGAQGTDIELITRIPIAQAMRMNQDTQMRMGVRASGQ